MDRKDFVNVFPYLQFPMIQEDVGVYIHKSNLPKISIKEKAWDKLQARLDNECEGNKSMNRNIREYTDWAMKEAKKE